LRYIKFKYPPFSKYQLSMNLGCFMINKSKINECPIRKSLQVLGGKWTILLLMVLETPKRYGELKKAVPEITEKMLIQKLRLLEKGQFVVRKDYQEIPPKVEYSLTKLGKETLKIIPILRDIGNRL